MPDTGTMLDVGLDDWMAAAAAEPDWEPDTAADANRLMGALRGIARQLAEDDATVKETVAEARAWQQGRAEALHRRQAELERLLESWARMRHTVTAGRETTWDLPNGQMALRKGQDRLAVAAPDEDALALRMEQNGYADLVRVKREVAKDAVKKAAVAGPELSYDDTPEGYQAHAVVEQATGVGLDGLVLLVPTEKVFSAKPRKMVL